MVMTTLMVFSGSFSDDGDDNVEGIFRFFLWRWWWQCWGYFQKSFSDDGDENIEGVFRFWKSLGELMSKVEHEDTALHLLGGQLDNEQGKRVSYMLVTWLVGWLVWVFLGFFYKWVSKVVINLSPPSDLQMSFSQSRPAYKHTPLDRTANCPRKIEA